MPASKSFGTTNRAGEGVIDRFLDAPCIDRGVMTEHIPEFLKAVEGEMSPATIWNYKTKLLQFSRWLEYERRDFSRRSVALFLAYLQEQQGLRPRTIRCAFTAIRTYARYLASLELEPPPLDGLKLPRLDKPQRVTPTPEEVAQLFDGAKRMPGHTDLAKFRKRLTLALLAVFAFCGLRAAEAMGLDVRDYDRDHARIRVRRGKGGESRWVPVNEHCAGHLGDWLEIRERVLTRKGRDERALFLNSKYQRLGEVGLKAVWDELLEVSGLGTSGIVRHSLRHWFASEALVGSDLETVKDLLGHANIQTTANYLHSTPERMKAATAKLANSLVLGKLDPAKEGLRERPRFRRRSR